MWKKIALGITTLLAIGVSTVLVAASRQRTTFTVARHLTVAVAPEVLRPFFTDLRRFSEWNPWRPSEPNMRFTFSEPSGGVGAHYEWRGHGQGHLAQGRVDLRSIEAGRIVYALHYFQPLNGLARIEVQLDDAQGERSVGLTLRMHRSRTFREKILALFWNTDAAIEPDFDWGLSQLTALALTAQAEVDRIEAERLAEARRIEAERQAQLDAQRPTANTLIGTMPRELAENIGTLMGNQVGDFRVGDLGLEGAPNVDQRDGTIGLGGLGGLSSPGQRTIAPTARVQLGAPRVIGLLPAEVVRRVVRRHINEVRFCYEQELRTRADLQGRVDVDFTISATGSISRAAVATSTLANTPVQDCMVSAVRRWTFPTPDGGGTVSVVFPFTLQPPPS